MKKAILLLSALMLLTTAQNVVKAQDLTLSDVQNSGCLRDSGYGRRRANETEERRTMILLKEGNILTVQLFNFEATCETEDFIITPKVNNGDPCFVSINVDYIDSDADCICPYNISFTLHDLEPNCFFFSCWWYEGQVNLIEGEPLVLEDIKEDISIDGMIYTLDKVALTAKLIRKETGESEVDIPSELSYDGQKYTVTGIGSYVFHSNAALTSITIPGSITYIGEAAFYGCSNLKEVCCQADDAPGTGSWVFDNTPIASATLHVPASSVDKYKATSPWNKFGNIVALPEEPRQPLSFLEGNPIWVYKYEQIPRLRDPNIICWIDTGERIYTYYFLGKQKEIEGKNYTMLGKVTSITNNSEGIITFNCWLPVREENGIIYTLTDSLLEVCEHEYESPGPYYEPYKKDELPYLQQGNECVLYNFCTEIGETLYPGDNWSVVESIVTYQLMDGAECRALKTTWGYELCEKLGYLNIDLALGIMVPIFGMIVPTNGDVYVNPLNAYYQDDTMLYKAPDALEGLCVNDTCWTREDAEAYAITYKEDPYHDEVMSFIRQLQGVAEPITFTEGQMATIILPTEPEASKGKYYRLDRAETGQIIFEQELHPQAHIPYIIVPSEDFSIDLSTLDLAGCYRDTVSVDDVSFIGSYVSEAFDYQDGFYIDFIDTTPDCRFDESCVIGALRAYLLVRWDDPYNQGGTKVPPLEKLEVVLRDYGTSIGEIKNEQLKIKNDVFDLSGRKIVNGQLQRGIYIENGQKKIAK